MLLHAFTYLRRKSSYTFHQILVRLPISSYHLTQYWNHLKWVLVIYSAIAQNSTCHIYFVQYKTVLITYLYAVQNSTHIYFVQYKTVVVTYLIQYKTVLIYSVTIPIIVFICIVCNRQYLCDSFLIVQTVHIIYSYFGAKTYYILCTRKKTVFYSVWSYTLWYNINYFVNITMGYQMQMGDGSRNYYISYSDYTEIDINITIQYHFIWTNEKKKGYTHLHECQFFSSYSGDAAITKFYRVTAQNCIVMLVKFSTVEYLVVDLLSEYWICDLAEF